MTTWRAAPLGEVTRVVGGSTPPTSDESNFGGDAVWITPLDLGRLRQPTIEDSARTITSAARRRAGIELLPPGTVVMSSRAPIGHLGVAGVSLCTNQGCKSFIAGPEIDPWFLYYMLRFRMAEIRALGSGATFAEVSKSDLETFEIEFPSVQEQTRIAKRLTHQVEIASGAAAMAVSRLQTARSLGLQILIGAFRHTSGQWPTRRLRDLVESRRSPSVNADGDTAVTTVTSGCLTPFGFALEGLRTGRMHSRDAVDGAVSRDEVLVSRSNTEALVGRASRYPGGTRTVVASDLVFRLVPEGAALDPEYLAGRLSVLQLDGYWRDRSSGASSTMKKITKALLFDVELALPPIAEQLRIVHMFQERMRSIKSLEAAIRSERTAIDALPAALLRRALGELAV